MAEILSVLVMLCQLLLVRTRNPMYFPCENDVNATAVDCSYRALNFVPAIRSTTVVSLNLSATKIQRLKAYAFSDIPNLQTLKIMGNCLSSVLRSLDYITCKMDIDHDAFKGLVKLHSLHLSGNSLTSLPWFPESLRILDLEYNHIFNIIHPIKTPNLVQLLLSKNCYNANPCYQSFYISEAVLRDLPKLKNLTLGYNNLTSIPRGLPPSLEALDLRENTITEVLEGAFANLTQLKHLNLEWNCQRCDHAARPCFPCPNNDSLHLHANSFYAENSLIYYLSLRGNSLRNIPEGLFRPLRNLQRLDLSDNLLAYAIRNGTFFSELENLTWISLIYNYEPLRTFPELVLSPHLSDVSHLKYILLSGNFFHAISMQSFEVLSKLNQLEYLELRMNFIASCNMSAFRKFSSLVNVDLSQNMLNFLPYSIQSAKYALQQSRENQDMFSFHDFPDPTLIQMYLWDIDHSHWESTDINMLGIFEYSVSKIPTIWDFRKKICLHNLTFDLSQNDILFLNKNVFAGMEKAVCLDISSNYMSQTLKGEVFQNMKNLVYLDMSYNRIDLYYREAFSELNSTLKVLDLSHNQFHFLLKGMGHRFEFITRLSQLEVLSLANNDIGMRIDAQLKSRSLKYLFFSGNHLDTMWDSSGDIYIHFFQELTNLIYLDISYNELNSISPDVLCNLPKSIEALSISNNNLKYFPWQNITALRNLRHLNLSQNHLSYIPNIVIEFGSDFALLDLSHNKILYLPENFLSEAKSLQFLYLHYNSLKQLGNQSLPAPWKNSSVSNVLTLHENPFKCYCDNSVFVDFLRTTPLQIPKLTTGIHCEFPESLQGKSVLSIDRRSCQEIYGSLAFLFSSFLAVAFTVLPLLKHLYGWDLWYCLQVLWAGHKGYFQLPGSDSHKQYDAFVVFDTENQSVRDWVYNELTVQLEDSGHRRFSLCLEERDWIPGTSCIENLHSAVHSSVKTVFVLSGGAAAVTGVIRQAFFMVQQRLLDEKVDVAVLVLLDEVFPKLKYLQLRRRLCRKSVMSWPRNPRAQPLFWNTFRMALSSDNLRFYDNNMSESFV